MSAEDASSPGATTNDVRCSLKIRCSPGAATNFSGVAILKNSVSRFEEPEKNRAVGFPARGGRIGRPNRVDSVPSLDPSVAVSGALPLRRTTRQSGELARAHGIAGPPSDRASAIAASLIVQPASSERRLACSSRARVNRSRMESATEGSSTESSMSDGDMPGNAGGANATSAGSGWRSEVKAASKRSH